MRVSFLWKEGPDDKLESKGCALKAESRCLNDRFGTYLKMSQIRRNPFGAKVFLPFNFIARSSRSTSNANDSVFCWGRLFESLLLFGIFEIIGIMRIAA
jgi:hypothetical protein